MSQTSELIDISPFWPAALSRGASSFASVVFPAPGKRRMRIFLRIEIAPPIHSTASNIL